MDEKLLTMNKQNDNDNNNNKMIYIIVPLFTIAIAYTALMVFIYTDIHNMSNNLDKIIDIINIITYIDVNTTSVDSMRNDLTLIKECILHKYCKRV
jgi:uncharacterized protein YoxC